MPRRLPATPRDEPWEYSHFTARLAEQSIDRWPAALAQFFEVLPAGSVTTPLELAVLFAELACEACRRLAASSEGHLAARGATEEPAGASESSGGLQTVRRLICQRYAEPLTLAWLARLVGRDPRVIAASFRRETGQTIHEFLTSIRITHAITHLARGDKIEFIGLAVGYRSKKNFYRNFRVVTGVTPATFRRLTSPDERRCFNYVACADESHPRQAHR